MAPVFEVEGSRGSSFSLGVFAVVIGVIGSLTLLIVAAAAPGMVGPWWLYAAILVASIAFAVRGFRQDRVMVRVSDGKLSLSGPTTAIDLALPGEVTPWISFVKGPHVGAKRLVQYNAIVTVGGRKLGFWNLAGAEGSEPADWPVQTSGVSCDEQFLCPRLADLVRILQDKG